MTAVAEYRASGELFKNLTLRELRGKYKRSVLGWTWSLLNPLSAMLIYTFLFSIALRIEPPVGTPSGINSYMLYLLSAMLPWNFFSAGIMGSISSLIGNANLIKKTYFPRQLLPAANLASALVFHLIEMSLLVLALIVLGHWQVIEFLPITLALILITAMFSLGLGLIISVLNVYFRDIEHFTGILLQIWMYSCPIIWPLSKLSGKHAWIVKFLKLNPMFDGVLCFRSTLYDLHLPGPFQFSYFFASSLVALGLGLWVFSRWQGRIAEEL